MRAASLLSLAAAAAASSCINEAGESGPCMPGHEFCGKPFPKDSSPAVRAGPSTGRLSGLSVSTVNRFCMALLYGRARRLTAENGGCRPGQFHLMDQHGCGESAIKCRYVNVPDTSYARVHL